MLCCFVIVLPWLWIRPLRKRAKPVLTFPPWEITLGAGVAGAVIWAFAMLAAYAGEDPESGYALVYWSFGILSLAIGGLHMCLKRVEEAGQSSATFPAGIVTPLPPPGCLPVCSRRRRPSLAIYFRNSEFEARSRWTTSC